MHKLFTYGTLQDETIEQMLFNKTLDGSKDSITGFEKQEIILEGNVYPILIKNNESTKVIKGTYYHLSNQEMLICDEYEGNEYKRVLVQLDSRIEAWVYIAS